MDGRTTETTMKSLAVFVALAAFAAANEIDYQDQQLVRGVPALVKVHPTRDPDAPRPAPIRIDPAATLAARGL